MGKSILSIFSGLIKQRTVSFYPAYRWVRIYPDIDGHDLSIIIEIKNGYINPYFQ